ncbi:mannose-1-phosphate guanylyltransferase [Aestuariimicrobium ganziense]|uniref:mannose-1-phosphate guanylyltransferase n=1 Tax=Aestuariimicrobium ganziense TaxID=2773677 RepID=UPI0019443DEA|nr:mannose-1-phosphate guanylyltransferase [Aestuariimicrobium ganziense]
MRHVAIMAGGSGKRLWPLSRQGEPKQLLTLIEGRSLLRIAYERIRELVPDANVLVCTGAAYADQVAAQLPELPPENLLGEPEGRDSLNAVAWSAAVIAARDPEAVMAVLTADHIMRPVELFRSRLEAGFEVAEQVEDAFVTFGVVPTMPATGFGYLHKGQPLDDHEHAVEVTQFKEKPSLEVAAEYLASGEYWWNSGMFVWRAATFLATLEQLMPQTVADVTALTDDPSRVAELYPQLVKVSVDYAVMEPVSVGRAPGRVIAVELPIEWYDVGSFQALAEHLPRDEHGNAVTGATVALGASGNLLINTRGEGTVLAVTGVHDHAVVTTPTATMVVPLADSELVKDLVALVAERHGAELG